jgi:hypothetical protein
MMLSSCQGDGDGVPNLSNRHIDFGLSSEQALQVKVSWSKDQNQDSGVGEIAEIWRPLNRKFIEELLKIARSERP